MLKAIVGLAVGVGLGFCTFAYAESGKWVDLFDGKTLSGWIQKNGTATYRAEDGTIVGRTTEGSPNSFLCTEKEYANFELEFDVKCDDRLNSGVQIRSKTKEVVPPKGKPDAKPEPFGRVYGPQVEIAAGAKSASGYIYGEAMGGGWRTPDDQRVGHSHFKSNEWNHYRVVANGPRIQTWINGQPIGDLNDPESLKTHAKGFIGLQVHGIKKGTGPFEVAWKNIRIRELP